MRFPFRERVEQRERADQDIVPGRGQSRTQSDQIRERASGDAVAGIGIRFQRAEQPGLEPRQAWTCDARQRRLARASLVPAKYPPETFRREPRAPSYVQ